MRELTVISFLIFSALWSGVPEITVKRVEKAPVLDGSIDEVWDYADSISGYTQFSPDYGKPSLFKTVVKILQDRENLYILGIGYTGEFTPEARLSGESDELHFYIDPFSSGQEAYYFEVKASGEHYDAIVTDNGAKWNYSWDAYWFSKVRVYPDRYVVEIRIPFRSLRYPENSTEWRFQASRYIPRFNEMSYWVLPPKESEHDFKSFGVMREIRPIVKGHGMEFYPVGVLRYDQYLSDTSATFNFGLDFSWNVLSNLMLNLTFKPDFAQIEADPFGLNLSRYERYLQERRPFFIEAREIFSPHAAEFGQIYNPFSIFYSRRIGRKLPDGSEVPIDIGTKLTYKAEGYQLGFMSVITGEKEYLAGDSVAVEPRFLWSVTRIKLIHRGVTLGFLLSSKTRRGYYTAASYDIDGKFEAGNNTLYYQIVGSSITNRKSGYGIQSAYFYMSESNFAALGIRHIDRNLVLDSTGYLAADPGDDFVFAGGKMLYLENRSLVSIFSGLFGGLQKSQERSSHSLSLYASFRWRAGYFLESSMGSGKLVEYGSSRTIFNFHLSAHRGGGARLHAGTWMSIRKDWNYSKGLFAWMGSGGIWSEYPVTPVLQANLGLRYWVEFDDKGGLMDIYSVVRPRLAYNFSPDMRISFNSELVFYRESKWNFKELRVGIRYFYEFRPKSRIYAVVNQHFERTGKVFRASERVYALKLRWAIPY